MHTAGTSFLDSFGRAHLYSGILLNLMKPAAILLLIPFLFAACREGKEESETSSADQIIQSLVRGGSNLPLDARFAVTSYMDTERIRIEQTRAQYAAKVASLEEKLEAAAIKRDRDAAKYRKSMEHIWDAIRSAEDPNLSEADQNVLAPYIPEAKDTAEDVAVAYEAASEAADLYLEALRTLQFDRAQIYHTQYLDTLKKISAIGSDGRR
jgi:hypothetical protein